MKSSDLLRIVETCRTVKKQLERNLTEKDITDLKIGVLDGFIQNLEILLMTKIDNINQTNSILSQKMSFENTSWQLLQNFYDLTMRNENETNILVSKLHALTNFSYPMLELFPGNGDFTEAAVAAEPLYIVDYHQETLDKVSSRFNSFYASRRLMKHIVRDFDLSCIPESQIGVVYSFNYFFIKEISFIVEWAKEVHKVLRPGGYFIFNFIPVNESWGVELTEHYQLAAIDYLDLSRKLVDVGFEILNTDFSPNYASTMLVKKQGDIKPFKLTSSSARIIDKSEPFV